ncbi:MAG TPA: RHS repeat domain-containing protein [Micromonosporaceae bacterium]|nr:RHS repeat domain-containing protein [Micromonosporaceae bacterium]
MPIARECGSLGDRRAHHIHRRPDVTPPAGGITTSTLTDARGHNVTLKQNGVAVSYAYNRKDQLARITDAAGNVWSHGYDLLSRRVSTVDPDAATSSS